MAVIFNPRTSRVMIVADHAGDVVLQSDSGNATLDNEDVPNFHTSFQNPDGSTGTNQPGSLMLSGIPNQFQGTLAGVQGANKEALTRRGLSKATHRTRTRFDYFEVKHGRNVNRL